MAVAASTVSASQCVRRTTLALDLPLARVATRPSLVPARSLRRLSGIHLRQNQRYGGARSALSESPTIGGSARAEVQYVDGEAAKKLVTEEGFSIIDIRDTSQYNRSHIPSSAHIPLFIDNTDNDIGTVINRQLHFGFAGLFYGVAFTKPNPDFIATVEKQFPKDSNLLLVCQEGLRSGTAADKLEESGFQNVAYLMNGLQKVKPGTFEKEGPKELADAGKAGLVTIQGQFSIVLGTILILAFLFLQFFPDQAEQLFFSNK